MLKYRPEIDGLRAIAVIPVIMFHAGFQTFSGGFVGVDVFFVISGYLITSILISEMKTGKFSIIDFYERRIRRILPPLFTVIIVCIPFAWLWMLPSQFKDFSQSIVSVVFFSSNILFWIKSGYFDAASELKPLLHTWSLAVEEQYYLFFPLLLLGLVRYGNRIAFYAIAFLITASFMFAEYNPFNDTSANFYLIFSRVWELGIGALVAVLHGRWSISKPLSELGSVSGLLLIGLSVFSYTSATPFPGVFALLPTLGAALIIFFASSEGVVGKLLTMRLMVVTGLISYSLYLWHQPIFAFSRLRLIDHPDTHVFIALILLSFLLAGLSYHFVEKPFRRKNTFSRKVVFCLAGIVSLSIVGSGLLGSIKNGYPERMGRQINGVLSYTKSFDPKTRECWGKLENFENSDNFCFVGNSEVEPTIGILGDSHAAVLIKPFDNQLGKLGISGVNYTYNSCLPLINGSYGEKGKTQQKCDEFRRWFYSNLDKVPDTLVLLARWPLFLNRNRFDNKEGGIESGIPVSWEISKTDRDYQQSLQHEYVSTIVQLLSAGKKVILVYSVPEAGWVVPHQIAKLMLLTGGEHPPLSTSYDVFLDRNKLVFEAFDSIQDSPHLIRIKPHVYFCNNEQKGRCSLEFNNVPLYYDDDHLSLEGAAILVDKIIENWRLSI